jgi:formylglycine-generating enzyme required for sulfatase activity
MKIPFRTSSELGLLAVACLLASGGCNAITNLDRYEFRERDVTHCGPKADEDCRTALPVEGGTFFRTFGPTVTPSKNPATVSSFRLDKFEVTVGRFRAFIDDVVAGRFYPQPGDGKHRIPKAGDGVRSLNSDRERGWRATDSIPTTLADWRQNLAPPASSNACEPHTFTNEPGDNENRPINCVSWAQAYAFCIWSGGFLPTDAEWEYAAAGGSKQSLFPWGTTPPPDAEHAVFGCVDDAGARHKCSGSEALFVKNIAHAGSLDVPGPFGHLDLAGNLQEWTADRGVEGESPPDPCEDCVADESSTATSNHIVHGGFFNSTADDLAAPSRHSLSEGLSNTTFRCAYPR